MESFVSCVSAVEPCAQPSVLSLVLLHTSFGLLHVQTKKTNRRHIHTAQPVAVLGTYSSDSGAALSEVVETGESTLNALNSVRELLNVSRELLSKGQGSGVLQVSATNLDDVLELDALGLNGIAKQGDSGDEALVDLDGSGNVHGSGEGIVRGLGHVDVVVGVNGLLGAELASEELNGAVGDDLVDVHVGLGAGTGLPNNQGKVVQELALDHLVGGLDDGLTNSLVEAVGHVDGGGSALQDTEGLDERLGHALGGSTNIEVLERTIHQNKR